jgi:hypothetical protein
MNTYYKTRMFLKFYIETLILFFVIVIPVILLHFSITQQGLFTSWNWFHDYVIYFLLGILVPFAATMTTLEILQDRRKIKKIVKSRLRNFSHNHHRFIYILVSISIVFCIGQTLGGCVWQIPNIIDGQESYSWNRFGHGVIPQPILIMFYFSALLYASWIGYHYYNLYVIDHLQKKYNTQSLQYKKL